MRVCVVVGQPQVVHERGGALLAGTLVRCPITAPSGRAHRAAGGEVMVTWDPIAPPGGVSASPAASQAEQEKLKEQERLPYPPWKSDKSG